ncbi:uncharacterized protein LOC111196715 isoform X3 [Astyanax mexicanus]|uniref:uncharacterized protein LOC111196715 isoform X3 n=1 Tax=Astyanax mexicanus TaxID=7994 RepID=UPI0020CAE87B|nr:uncharacterized protein LOC111196715 isoform X3 [Astyanax mexicanus]
MEGAELYITRVRLSFGLCSSFAAPEEEEQDQLNYRSDEHGPGKMNSGQTSFYVNENILLEFTTNNQDIYQKIKVKLLKEGKHKPS